MNLQQRRINFESIIKVEALLAFAEKTHPRQSAPSGFAFGGGDISDYRANLNTAAEMSKRCF